VVCTRYSHPTHILPLRHLSALPPDPFRISRGNRASPRIFRTPWLNVIRLRARKNKRPDLVKHTRVFKQRSCRVYARIESHRRNSIGTRETRHYIIDVRNKIVSRVLSVYEYDSIRFYIKTMEINARFSHIFIIRITESRAITKTVYY